MNLLQYIVKDQNGHDASVQYDASNGGTRGLKLFGGKRPEEVCGVRAALDLGTAFIIMDGGQGADWVISQLQGRILIQDRQERCDWRFLDKSEEQNP